MIVLVRLTSNLQLAGMLGYQDIRQAYRRSALGPFWLTAGMAVQILSMGLVFGIIFKSDLQEYLPFLASSIVIWGYISSCVNEGCMALIGSEPLIKQARIPHFVYVIRVIWRSFLTGAHNAVLLPIVFMVFGFSPNWNLLGVFPGFILLTINMFWVIWVLALISSRYRDFPPVVGSVMTIAFYVTPVMWYPKLITNDSLAHLLLGLNPFYHWVQIVRLPMLGLAPTLENWVLSSFSAVIGCATALFLYKRTKSLIAYWV